MRDFAHDCLFFVNLAELAMFLEDRFDLAEERFWSLARRVVEDHRRRFPELAERAARFDVLAPEVSVEQLTTRRLLPDTEVRLQRGPQPAELSSMRIDPTSSPRCGRRATGRSAPTSTTSTGSGPMPPAAVAALPEGCELFYALKANSERPIIEALAGIVAGFEVGSAGEIDLVRAVAPRRADHLRRPGQDRRRPGRRRPGAAWPPSTSRASTNCAGPSTSPPASASRLPVALRVNLAGPLPVATLAMAGRPTQFGIDEGDVPAALALAQRCPHLDLVGFHFHCLSNHHDAPAHARLVAGYLERARRWAGDAGVPLRVVNAGGGIGVDYAALDRPFDWAGFCAALAAVDAAPIGRAGARPAPVRVRPLPGRGLGRLRHRGARREGEPRRAASPWCGAAPTTSGCRPRGATAIRSP